MAQLEHSTNMADVETLFSIIKDEIVRDQLIALSAAQLQANRMVKEVYLPLGRKMELVTCTFDGGRTGIEESENIMEPEHLSVFSAQCALPLYPLSPRATPTVSHTATHTHAAAAAAAAAANPRETHSQVCWAAG